MAGWEIISADPFMEGNKLDEKNMYPAMKEAILRQLDHSRGLSNQELKECIEQELKKRDKDALISFSMRKQYEERLFAAFRKFGVLQELIEDEEVTEILVNGPAHIFYEKNGALQLFSKTFSGEEELADLIQTICAGGNRMVNEASPIVDTRL